METWHEVALTWNRDCDVIVMPRTLCWKASEKAHNAWGAIGDQSDIGFGLSHQDFPEHTILLIMTTLSHHHQLRDLLWKYMKPQRPQQVFHEVQSMTVPCRSTQALAKHTEPQ